MQNKKVLFAELAKEVKSMSGSGVGIMATIDRVLGEHSVHDPFEQMVLSREIYHDVTGNELDLPKRLQRYHTASDLMTEWAAVLYNYSAHQCNDSCSVLCVVNRTLEYFRIPHSERKGMRSKICSNLGTRGSRRRQKAAKERLLETVQPSLPFTTPPSASR